MNETIVTEQEILDALKQVNDPDLHRDIVSLGFVRNIRVCGGEVAFDINLTTPACPVRDEMKAEAQRIIEGLRGVDTVNVTMTAEVKPHSAPDQTAIAGVKNIIAVGSGKGGVGKSTVAVNLAVALAQTGAKVGLLDGDIYGPSIPIMMGVKRELEMRDGLIVPHEAHGVRFMSMGYYAPGDKPLIWRGPMATKALQQCLLGVDWGELDYMLIDLPPGTGDVHLTLVQTAPLTGGVLVSTPQDVGLTISLKTYRLFQQTNVDMLGIVENMSYYICPHCGERDYIFGHGQVEEAAQQFGMPFLGAIPLDSRIRSQADLGTPIVAADPEAPIAQAYKAIAERVAAQVSIKNYKGLTEGNILQPRDIQAGEAELSIVWGDGKVSTYANRELRGQCPCAACVDEFTHERRVDAASVPADVRVLNVQPVGNYAVRLVWSDGHNTGLYSFEMLRALG